MPSLASKVPTDHIPIKFTAEERVIIDHYRRTLDAAVLSKDDDKMAFALSQLQKFVEKPKAPRAKYMRALRKEPVENVLKLRSLVKRGMPLTDAAMTCRMQYNRAYDIITGRTYRDII